MVVGDFGIIDRTAVERCVPPVSYTHLDVYKRQLVGGTAHDERLAATHLVIGDPPSVLLEHPDAVLLAGIHLFTSSKACLMGLLWLPIAAAVRRRF